MSFQKTEPTTFVSAKNGTAWSPENLYDALGRLFKNPVVMRLGDTWIAGTLVPLGELSADGNVRRLGSHGIEVLAEAPSWSELVAEVLPRISQR